MFVVAIMSFVWRTTADNDNPSTLILSPEVVLVLRVLLSSILVLGFVDVILVTKTFRHYGEALDKDWDEMISDYQAAKQEEGWRARFADFIRSDSIPVKFLGFSQPMNPLPLNAPSGGFNSWAGTGPMPAASSANPPNAPLKSAIKNLRSHNNNPIPTAIPGPMPATTIQWDNTSTSSCSSDGTLLSPKLPHSTLRNGRPTARRSQSPRRVHRLANDRHGKNNTRSSK